MVRRAVLIAMIALIAFTVTLVAIWLQIRLLKRTSLRGRDMHKSHDRLIPEMGGLSVMIGFYAAIQLLFMIGSLDYALMYMSLFTIMAVGVIGILDDLFRMRQIVKAILPFLAAIPFGFYMLSYDTTIRIPLLFSVDVGWLMFLLVPLAITSAANSANMLEGLNGLGTGMMLIMAIALSVGSIWYAPNNAIYLTAPLAGALLAFLIFNWYPARIFPGDTLTLFAGATLCAAAMIGGMKLLGALLFLPMIVEFFLKARGRFRAQNFGTPDRQGRLHYRGPIQSLTHLMMVIRPAREKVLVLRLWAIQATLAIVALWVIFST